MGNGIAHVFAQYGNKVNLVDVNQAQLDRALQTITKNLDRQVSKGIIDEAAKNATLANLSLVTDLKTGTIYTTYIWRVVSGGLSGQDHRVLVLS